MAFKFVQIPVAKWTVGFSLLFVFLPLTVWSSSFESFAQLDTLLQSRLQSSLQVGGSAESGEILALLSANQDLLNEAEAASEKSRGQVRLYRALLNDLELRSFSESTSEAEPIDIIGNYQQLNQIHQLNSDQAENGGLEYNVAYHAREREQVTKAFTDHGVLKISDLAASLDIKSTRQPWSSFWYPYRQAQLLYGQNSPLEKLDLILRNQRKPAGAVQAEQNNLSGLEPDSWEGHCFPWAMAAVLFTEPARPVAIERVNLTVADQKALLLKTVEAAPFIEYGIRYRGNASTDGTFQDIRPEAFHKLLIATLGAGRALLIDDDPGVEVWTKPVFGAKISSQPVAQIPNALEVTTWIGMVRQRDQVSDELTSDRDFSWAKYTYRLYFNPAGDAIAGEWTGESIENHPDAVFLPAANATSGTGSLNPIINSNFSFITSLVR